MAHGVPHVIPSDDVAKDGAEAAVTVQAPGRRTAALDLMLAELEDQSARLADLDRARGDLLSRRGELIAALAPLISGLPEEERRQHSERVTRMTAAEPQRTRPRWSPRSEAVMRYLIESEHDLVRTVELTWYLRRMGHAVCHRYAPEILMRLAAEGYVTPTSHGIYALNRTHPDVIQMEREGRGSPD